METDSLPLDFAQLGPLMKLAEGLDLAAVAELAERVDLGELIGLVARMDEGTLAAMKKMMASSAGGEAGPPPVDSDLYDIRDALTDEERRMMEQIHSFMVSDVAPVIAGCWARDETPVEVLRDGFRRLDVATRIYGDGTYKRAPHAAVLEGLSTMEIARVDPSTATFFGVQFGLVMQSLLRCGSDEQKAEWFPQFRHLDAVGAFALAEPKVGSAAAGGLTTTCRRDGDGWVLNGQKKWTGNATFADLVIVWARDEADASVRGFLVRAKENPGYAAEKITGKTALRAVENGLVTLTGCRVPESDRLLGCTSFRDVADVLRVTRAGVAWIAVGCAMGAYEHALAYVQQRRQFGRSIGSFQLVQAKLVQMLGNVTAMQTMCLKLSRLQDEGRLTDEQASLAKVFTTTRCRETVALARELLGGNGILLDHHVARFFADAEAIYSYEGTHEINTLIVGRAITGIGAFV
ncbi:MAG: acyl-CoA dehydrogenase family protein [Bacteroidota bacterium]